MTTGGAMTIASWVRFDSTSANGWERVIDLGQANSGGLGNIIIARMGTTNDLAFIIEKNGNYSHRATVTNGIVNGTWMHVAATVDAAGNMTLYVNGASAATATGVAPDVGVRTNQFIGRSNFAVDGAFDGAIDDLLITNGAMSAAAIANLYQQSNQLTIAENSANGSLVTTVYTTDPDAGNTYTYSLTNNAGGRFTIDATSGQVTVANSSLLNFESATSHAITVRVTDQGGLAYDETITVNLSNVNESPTFSNLNGTPTYVENGSAVVLDADATITDPELAAGNNYSGSTLTLVRNGGASSQDVFSASGTLSTLTQGGNLVVGGTTIGTVTTNSGGTLVLTFNSSATGARVNSVMQQIAYSNSSDAPPSSVQVNWTFNDGNTGAQGTGGALSATGSAVVSITPVNDVPVIASLDGDVRAATEGGGAVLLGSTTGITDPDSADFNTGTLTVSFTSGSDSTEDVLGIRNEGTGVGQIGVSGSNITYGGVTIGTWTGGSNGNNLVVTLNANANATNTAALVNNLTYLNTDTDSPTTTTRNIRVVLTDGDGGTSVNNDTTMTVSLENDAPVLTPIGPTLPLTENGGAYSNTVAALLGSSVTDPDSGAVEGIAITGLTLAGGTLEYSLDGTNWTAVSGVSTSNALLLRATDQMRFTPSTTNGGQTLISYHAWDQTSGTAGGTANASTTGGTTAFSTATDTITVNVTSVNDAPVLDNSGTMTLTSITEDSTSNSGQTVASIIASAGGDRITDVDSGAVEGIAITALNSGNGTWQYSLDGTTWNSVGTVSTTSSLLLRSTDLIRFLPNGQNATTASFDFQAWDTTTGTAGTKVSAASAGGSTAFSTATETASISVTAVNDNIGALSDANAGTNTVAENATIGTTVGITALAIDVDAGDTVTYSLDFNANGRYAINSTTGVVTVAGALNAENQFLETILVRATSSDGSVVTRGYTITVTSVNEAPIDIRLPVTAASENFESGASGWSNTQTIAGGPTLTNYLGGWGNEIGATQVFKDFALSGLQSSVTITFDMYEVDTWDGEAFKVWIDGVETSSMNMWLDQYNNMYLGRENEVAITQQITDGLTNLGGNATYEDEIRRYTFTINTTASSIRLGFSSTLDEVGANENWGVDNLSIIENRPALAIAENAANGTTVGTVQGYDVDTGTTLTYSLTDNAGGRFAINASTGVITVADGSLLNFEAATSHNVSVQISDGSLTYSEAVTINLTNVNEGPIAVSDTATAVEAGGTANGTSGTNPTGNVLTNDTDVDAGDTKTVSGVAAGTVGSASSNVGSAVSGAYGSINISSTGAYTYTVDNTHSAVQALRSSAQTLTDVFTYTMRDTAGSTSTTQITVTIQGANDAPAQSSIEGSALSYNESSGAVAITSTLALTDVDDTNLVSATVQITGNYQAGQDLLTFTNQNGISGTWDSVTGTLTLTGSATKANYQTALRSVGYSNSSELPSTATRTVSFNVSDGALQSTTVTRDISVISLNDAPTISAPGSALSATEQTALAIHGAGFSLADVDAGSGAMSVTMSVGQGTLTLAAGNSGISVLSGNGTSSVVVSGTLSQLNNWLAGSTTGTALYLNSSDTPSSSTTLTLTVNDQGNTGSDPGLTGDGTSEQSSLVHTINLTAVNDAPINITPGTLFTGVNVTLTMSGANAIQVSDVDAASSSIRVTLNASHGTLTLSSTSGLSFTTGDGTNDSSIVMTGSVASINAALDGMQFIPTNGYTGSASISLLTEDLGNTGTGGNLTDTDVIAIQVGGLRFQEGSNGYTGTQDTYVSSGASSTAYGNATSVLVDDPGQHGLIRFDNIFGSGAGQIAYGSTITNASLSIYVTGTDNLDTVAVHRMLAAWTETSTWNSLTNGIQANNVEAATSITYTIDAGIGGWITITGLTSTVQAWSDGAANNGWALLGDSVDNWTFHSSEFATVSLRPYLTVAFSAPQSADIDLDANNSAGVSGSGYVRTWTENAGAVAIADIDATISDADSSNLQSMTIAISNLQDGTAELLAANTSGTSITASYNSGTGTLTLSGTDTVAHYQQVLRTVTYNNTSESPTATARLITVRASDAYVNSNLATATINIVSLNDAPVLDSTGNMSFTTITEDAINNSGNSVASIISSAGGDRITDVDAGSVEGIAITSLSSGTGTWQYSLNGGSSWSDVGSVGNSSALLLRSTDLLRFVPNGLNGTAGDVTFRAWDQTSGVAGTKADTASGGGTSAFSSSTEVASITVTSVNDNPLANLDAAIAVEAGGVSNATPGTNPSGNVLTNDTDVDSSDTRSVVGVLAGTQSSATGNVSASVSGSYGSITIAADGSYTYSVNNNNAAVQALRNSSNTLNDVFTYTISDAGGLTSTTQITITIQGANDTPLISPVVHWSSTKTLPTARAWALRPARISTAVSTARRLPTA